MTVHTVCSSVDLAEGQHKMVGHHKGEVGVVRFNGRLVAIRNRCPHAGARLLLKEVRPTTVAACPHQIELGYEDGVFTCPWHHWEFDLRDGSCLADPRLKLEKFPVEEADGTITVEIPD
uniref:Rieske (2Fe-2S) protein n=1 Tax=Ensifer adhaerens TaxID=106592 RepID=UPI003F4999DB